MDQVLIDKHLKAFKNTSMSNFQRFKKFWHEEIQIVAQDTVGIDAEILFYCMEESCSQNKNKIWFKIKMFFKKMVNKKYITNRLDWYAVYYIVDMISKVNEQLQQGNNPTVAINRVLQIIGNYDYYDNFPNKECNEVKMYKLLAIKLAEGLKILNAIEQV